MLKTFGECCYENTVYVSFTENEAYKAIFEPNRDVDQIVAALAKATGRTIEPGRTLIVFDTSASARRRSMRSNIFARLRSTSSLRIEPPVDLRVALERVDERRAKFVDRIAHATVARPSLGLVLRDPARRIVERCMKDAGTQCCRQERAQVFRSAERHDKVESLKRQLEDVARRPDRFKTDFAQGVLHSWVDSAFGIRARRNDLPAGAPSPHQCFGHAAATAVVRATKKNSFHLKVQDQAYRIASERKHARACKPEPDERHRDARRTAPEKARPPKAT